MTEPTYGYDVNVAVIENKITGKIRIISQQEIDLNDDLCGEAQKNERIKEYLKMPMRVYLHLFGEPFERQFDNYRALERQLICMNVKIKISNI